jgi:hypothetical protein
MKIRLSELKKKAESRPEGYYEKVVSMGNVDNDVLSLTSKAYFELLKIYDPAAINRQAPSGCTTCGKATPPNTPNPAKPRPLPMPPLKTQVVNAASAASRVISNIINRHSIKAPDDIIASRKEVCNGCEFLDNTRDRCSKCGCYYKMKITLRSERCPIGKWEKVS